MGVRPALRTGAAARPRERMQANMQIGLKIQKLRKKYGLTQQELADQLGVSNKTVSRWESGSYPDVTTLVAWPGRWE